MQIPQRQFQAIHREIYSRLISDSAGLAKSQAASTSASKGSGSKAVQAVVQCGSQNEKLVLRSMPEEENVALGGKIKAPSQQRLRRRSLVYLTCEETTVFGNVCNWDA